MDILARFYTEDIVSKLLVHEISLLNPKIIVDLGIGTGSLTNAAFQKWGKAAFFGIDIDIEKIESIERDFPYVTIVEANGLHANIDKKLNLKIGSVDIAICNPPYLKIPSKQNTFLDLFKKVGLPTCTNLKYLTSDLIFLAQNILLLKEGGELGIILPDGLLSNKEFNSFRQDLIDNHTIISIIQLPDEIFKKAEARTHILILKKGKKESKEKVNLFLSDIHGNYIDNLSVEPFMLVDRMDFYYHKLNQKIKKSCNKTKTLFEIGAEIKRGRLTHAKLKTLNKNYIHTTTLSHLSEISLVNDISNKQYDCVYTDVNDILMARVGKGCIGKVSLVKEGNQLISDCVYRIRVPKKYLKQVWASVCSKEGQLWLKANSHGTCAKLISKSDLYNFPVKIK